MFFYKNLFRYLNRDKIKTIYLIDILYMKDINAIYGFTNGTYIIKQVFTLLKKSIKKQILSFLKRKINICIQNSYADIFSMILYDELNEKEIIEIQHIIFNTIIKTKFNLYEMTANIDINITIGCSKSKNMNRTYIYAEQALYTAKVNYINFLYYDSALIRKSFIKEELIAIIQTNIKNKLVEPYLQPIYDNKLKKVYKYEALMRIFSDDKTILPQVFIDKARKFRLFNQLMEIMIIKVLDYINMYKIHISINLDYDDIQNPILKNLIINNIKNNDIGNYLTIEILESKRISNFDIVNDFINKLKQYNVSFAIDDFGSGFSNYEHILKINTDYIKIDSSLIKNIDKDIYFNLIKNIVLFANEQNIKIIAEHVNNLSIQRHILSLGIRYSQGYYFNKAESIEYFLKKEISGKYIKTNY